MDIPEIADARRLRMRPGDVLALRLDYEPPPEDADEIKARVAELFGWPVPVMILSYGAEIGVIGPEEPQAAGIVKQAALEALLSTGFDPFNARAVLGMGPDGGG